MNNRVEALSSISDMHLSSISDMHLSCNMCTYILYLLADLRCWTCFEECLVNHIDEMKDRHVDQFIMCCIYAIGKVCPHFSILASCRNLCIVLCLSATNHS